MEIDDLEGESRSLGGYPPVLVDLLVERGHVELLVRAASRGAWSCARAAARELCKTAEFERALGVLEPFVELGWEPARWAAADVMLQAGRVQQALDWVRPDDTGLASEHACRYFAELLVKAGQVDEAIAVLTPHLDRGWLLSVLVELTEGQNRDERVLELLAPRPSGPAAPAVWSDGTLMPVMRRTFRPGSWNARAASTRPSGSSGQT
ncbi:hypothetical protein ACFWXA_34600 [Streptomyces atroolivaceus]|uniref:hypothetical protein n=1 Tax=Streptomyces atroolivaceus TaxID=66869 RepID=UPI003657379A